MGQNLSAATIPPEITFDPFAMLAIIRKLSKILTEEIALLDEMKIVEMHKSYNDKIELIILLENYKEILKQNPEILTSIPKFMLDELRDESAKFEILVEEDNKQIARAKEVHKVIMEAVRKVLEQNAAMNSGYNKKGLIDLGSKGAFVATPVSVNKKI